MTIQEAQAIIDSKYPQSRVQEILPNGGILLLQNNGKTMSRIRATEFATMAQVKKHQDERPEQPKLDEFTMNAILIEKFGEAAARRHPKWTQMTEEPQHQDTSGLLPSEMSPAQRGLPSNQNRAKAPKLPSEKW